MFQETGRGQEKFNLDRLARDFQTLELGERGIEGLLEVLPRMIRDANRGDQQGCPPGLPIRRRPPLRRQNQPP